MSVCCFSVHRLMPEFLANMIPETTPGDPLWTPCPSCRAQGKPVHPHGLWTWNLDDADHIQCNVCGMVFPNGEYPKDVTLQTKWRKPQTIRFCGGDPFVIFGYKTGRPSFTANVRSRKVKWIAGYCRSLAEAHLLTGKPEYARACRAVLLRFAECYPTWLVHAGYGEYADMDPRVASLNINRLPEPELCAPPNQPDRRLHTGYWSAGGVGMCVGHPELVRFGLFRVEGGERQDYVYHGFTNTCGLSDLTVLPAASERLYDFTNIRTRLTMAALARPL